MNEVRRKWVSVAITTLLAALMTVLGIYGIGEYGMALFILTPIFIGFSATCLYCYQREVTIKKAWRVSMLTLGIFSLALLAFAIEGLICMVMASPIALGLTWIGSTVGYAMSSNRPGSVPPTLLALLISIPLTSFVEKSTNTLDLHSVTTSVEINADPQTVWKNVVEFPQLPKPTEFIFQTGIAYPINAKIEGNSVGAIRRCNFTTGSFVEPITVWDQPNLLTFDVLDCPAPMIEISFWDVDTPHLHNYFVSKRGQFKLTKLANNKTLLEGTTWYYHDIRPVFYWRIWSDYILHTIHQRVLNHIKVTSEKNQS